MALLELKDIEVNYGSVSALRSISFKVEERGIITLTGSNGARKSVIIRTIMELKESGEGAIAFNGEGITNKDTKVMASRGIILSPEGRQVLPKFTALDNPKLGVHLGPDAEIEESLETVYQLFPKLLIKKEQMAGTLPGGEQQMLAAGRVMMGKPRLLLLDELSLGLAPPVIKEIFEMILRIRSTGAAIPLVERDARVALKRLDRTYVLEAGKIVLENTTENLLNSDEIRRAYLGSV